jgi:hypothetical protein
VIHGITAGAALPPEIVSPDPNAVSLLHLDGIDAATSFTDEAGVIWTPNGAAQLDTAQAKFGSSSLAVLSLTDWIDAVDPVFAVGLGDFTAECFCRLTTVSGNHFLFGFGSGWGVYALNFNNGFALFDGLGSNLIVGAAGLATLNTWHHVALTRASGSFTLWLNGVAVAGSAANATDYNVGNMRLGAQTTGGGSLNGWIDEWRFSDLARYTVGFTPPAAPFTNP